MITTVMHLARYIVGSLFSLLIDNVHNAINLGEITRKLSAEGIENSDQEQELVTSSPVRYVDCK